MTKTVFYKDPHQPIYAWVLITGILLFGLFLLWRYELFDLVLEADQTYLSIVILALFGLTCVYLGFASWKLTKFNLSILNYYAGSSEIETSGGAEDWLSEHFNLAGKISDEESVKGDALHARLVERVHRGHSLGWYIVDVLIRLGLIGTVIGFIMMLGAVYRLNDEDVTVLQDLLGSMGAGMQVALYTTLTGISASLVLSIYCKALDRFADDLISNVIKLTVNTASEKTIVKPV